MPSHDEVERAIRSVPGVAEATIARAQGSGRGRLRIRLHPGEDPERVSWSVAATLRERFGIALDPEEIRPRVTEETAATPGLAAVPGTADEVPPPARADEVLPPAREGEAGDGEQLGRPRVVRDEPVLVEAGAATSAATSAVTGDGQAGHDGPVARAGSSGRSQERAEAADAAPSVARAPWRPTIRDLSSRNDGTVVAVTARLELDGRVVAGEAAGAPTARGLRRAIADATVRAVGELTRSPLRAQVDRVSVGGSDPASVSVVVSLLSGRGEELLLGAAIVRDDVEHAVMRATLDALNRRVEPELIG